MRHPPYHLRLNKAVDRFLLVDSIRTLYDNWHGITYYGFGGPFLEDFRLLHTYFPDIKLISFENDEETYKRQQFHKFTNKIALKKGDFKDFIISFDGKGNEIFWLDFTDLKLSNLELVEMLISKVSPNTIIRITFPVREVKVKDITKFKNSFDKYLSPDCEDCFEVPGETPFLIQKMTKKATQKGVANLTGISFQLLSTVTYQDGIKMLSITGIVCEDGAVAKIKQKAQNLLLSNTDWSRPKDINVPPLSVKERLKLEDILPLESGDYSKLEKRLGYSIGDNGKELLTQYSMFHSCYPYFAKMST